LDVAIDVFFEEIEQGFYGTYEVFFEDGLKFVGIATWLAFYLRYSYNIFSPAFESVKAKLMDK
jgi:hypothetical protein